MSSPSVFRYVTRVFPLSYVLTVCLYPAVAVSPLFLASSVWAAAAQIKSITPSCAASGESVRMTGNGFGATNLRVTVDNVPATVSSATGNQATFVIPAGVTPGVVAVTATNPGGQNGSIALRVKGPEVCGDNTVDENCDGQVNEGCTPLNHPPLANAGPDKTQPMGTTVSLDGTGSSDPDGDAFSFQWTLSGQPATSTTTLTNPASPTPTFVIDKAGAYHLHLVVSDGQVSSVADVVIVSTVNSAPVAQAGDDRSGQVGDTLTLNANLYPHLVHLA